MHLADRRYYRELAKKSRNYAVRMDKKQWCDLHHDHFDWDGKGNAGKVHRLKHLNALFRALRRARIELESYGRPYQLFAYVDLKNSANDALYVHTPNPNGSEFPNPIESVSVLVQAPPILCARVDSRQYEVRRYSGKSGSIYYVIPKASSEA
jgi:hypothetical protein